MNDIYDIYFHKKKLHATGLVNPKVTSLFFDRVWLPSEYIAYNSNEAKSIIELIELNSVGFSNNFYLSYDCGAIAYMGAAELNCGRKILSTENISEIEYFSTHHRNLAIEKYAHSVKQRFGIDVVPVYFDSTSYDKEVNHTIGNPQSNVVNICVENFPKIAEDKLSWEQVLEFKSDDKASKSIEKFHRWIRLELVNKDKGQIEDYILKSLDDFKFSLKKHGIEATTGAISTIITAIPSFLETLGVGNSLVPLSISLAAGISIYTINKTISYIEKRREPIAFIYDIIKKL